MQAMLDSTKHAGNKGFNKVLGDVFEAYVAALITADPEHGFAIAEKWLTALWAPKLEESIKSDRTSATNQTTNTSLAHSPTADPLKIYNPTAKADLQRRILAGQGVKLSYEKYRDSVELKGEEIGQSRHFIALFLTGYGYERKLLGKGEGGNKVEAGNGAAQEAMFGESRVIVDECEGKMKVMRAEREAKRGKEMEEKGGVE